MNQTQIIATYYDTVTANIVCGRLKEDGVSAFLQDDGIVGMAPENAIAYGGVKLRVPNNQLEQARAILADIEAGPDEEWEDQEFGEEGALEAAERALAVPSGGELTCPRCGSKSVNLGWTGRGMFGLTAVVGGLPFVVSPWTAWGTLLHTYGLRLGAFLAFVSVVLYFMRAFDMRCAGCGHTGERSSF